jgi:serine/threonine protein phosphatase PrpC
MADAATLKSPRPQSLPGAPSEAARVPAAAFAMLSHQGRVRHANQDACAARPELGAFVVCDGVGGAAAGEVASQLAAEAFLHALSQPRRRRLRRTSPKPEPDAGDADEAPAIYPEGHPHSRLHEAVRAANQAVFRQSRKSSALRGMGTTLVAALWDDAADATMWLAHVGDSRCYRLRANVLHLLTEDHSLVEEQVRAGMLSRVQADASPMRNIITRAVGAESLIEAEIATHTTQPGDVYLLTTDGLTRELDDAEIAEILMKFFPGAVATTEDSLQAAALESACEALVDASNAHGGRDNITVLLVACSHNPLNTLLPDGTPARAAVTS